VHHWLFSMPSLIRSSLMGFQTRLGWNRAQPAAAGCARTSLRKEQGKGQEGPGPAVAEAARRKVRSPQTGVKKRSVKGRGVRVAGHCVPLCG
jgi:hypothetical protein